MGSTASDETLAKTAGKAGIGNDNGKKNATDKKSASRKSPAGKQASGKKTVPGNRQSAADAREKPRKKAATASKQAPAKSRKKASSASRKTARPEDVTRQAVEPEAKAEPAEDAAVANTTAEASGDSRSISWMSTQAVSALNAVRASQARKAEALLARVEKPVPGRPGITELPEQTSEDLLEEIPGMEDVAPAAPAPVTAQETTTPSPAAAGDTQTIQKEVTVMQEKPDTQATTAADIAANTTDSAATEVHEATPVNAGQGDDSEATASREDVIAAQAQQRGLPARPIVMTVLLAMLAYGGYHYWQENREPAVAPPPVSSGFTEGVGSAAWSDVPQQEAISVVGTTTGQQTPSAADPAASAPDRMSGIPAQPGTGIDAGIAATPAAGSSETAPGENGGMVTGETGVTAVQPAADMAPPPAAQDEVEATEPAEAPAEASPEPQTATVAAPPPSPAQPQQQPQQPYGAPGYGYYPQQPGWQQPYYQPAYRPQYPAR